MDSFYHFMSPHKHQKLCPCSQNACGHTSHPCTSVVYANEVKRTMQKTMEWNWVGNRTSQTDHTLHSHNHDWQI